MLAKTLPLLLLCTCASTAQLPMADQPEFAEIAKPYAQELQAVGVTRVISLGSGAIKQIRSWPVGQDECRSTVLLLDVVHAMVQLETGYGSVYVRYPLVSDPLTFVLDIGPDGVRATAAAFDSAKGRQILAALLPEAMRATAANNRLGWLHANPEH